MKGTCQKPQVQYMLPIGYARINSEADLAGFIYYAGPVAFYFR